jgi:hypothetical protein
MKEPLAARVARLRTMTVAALREQHRELFGEETRSRNRDFLWKRLAWRVQALEEGDVSERVRRRAAEIANDADIRVRAPQGAFEAKDAAAPERTSVRAVGRVHDPRLPMPGTVLTRVYKGKALHVTVLDEGFLYEGRTYRSLSAIATEATGSRWNGFLFFGLAGPRAAAGGDR